jgi:crotonobetainyl-CoA:carnitine CoA-transferase CaiB-like acyl-CoA transferase
VFIGVVSDSLWEKFCALFGLDDLWADESIRTNNARVLARDRILPRVRALLQTMTRAEIIARLEGTGLPFAPIGRPEDLFDDTHLAGGGLEEVTLDDGTVTRLPTIPLELDGKRPGQPVSLPRPGADGAAILADLGYDADEIARLIGSGTVEAG